MNKPKSDKEELDPAKTEVLDKIADFILKKDLDVLAVMTIESMRPLHFLGSQAMLFFEPFLGVLIKPEKIKAFREAMEESKYIDYLLARIENPPTQQ
ncbi:MAG: hypothetical protein A2504_04990 [Bdellovibrionales bacterium RIFOXYD12_FULL_39_22]|nr:MAG: hypothetical protein A2385_06835 [Bdellovibrionales bacterium RIFOXYB1_FULL_39_21]OFZ41985.1 MAG: hypothetical protein A2485_08805 [Bdellovibrionales bacterium RIFOXYC12_FULL_39_17]OFZ50701.1 MAG: hypothetical protein A2404_05755 [Bdellovibrionales bacterium RIFOXYC1_FULL_39_130]OFZ76449.1 MAG: hypothetical protein A2451_09380 [Bdellovibrionales bacterium RIFOXYC2_FULL_39_8]OFZ77924.1 MAG: hypothetical protein A2560_00925 [Bdellovibrionales bacterium RIFOXYD1_FULL_39_84]OFZ93640.1 MAG: